MITWDCYRITMLKYQSHYVEIPRVGWLRTVVVRTIDDTAYQAVTRRPARVALLINRMTSPIAGSWDSLAARSRLLHPDFHSNHFALLLYRAGDLKFYDAHGLNMRDLATIAVRVDDGEGLLEVSYELDTGTDTGAKFGMIPSNRYAALHEVLSPISGVVKSWSAMLDYWVKRFADALAPKEKRS